MQRLKVDTNDSNVQHRVSIAETAGALNAEALYHHMRKVDQVRKKSPYPLPSERPEYDPTPENTNYLQYLSHPAVTLPITSLPPSEWTKPRHSRRWLLPRAPALPATPAPFVDARQAARRIFNVERPALPDATLAHALDFCKDGGIELPSIADMLAQIDAEMEDVQRRLASNTNEQPTDVVGEALRAAALHREARVHRLQAEGNLPLVEVIH